MKTAKRLPLALCSMAVLLVGCASEALPPSLTQSQARRLHELPLPNSIGVARYKYPVYSQDLTKALISAHVFRAVAPLESLSRPPDFIAYVEETIHGASTIPVAALLTAGLVPSTVSEEHGYIFSLAPASQQHRKIMVDAHYQGTTTLGWVALPIGVLPGYTFLGVENSTRFRKMLAYRTLVALHPAPPSAAKPMGTARRGRLSLLGSLR